MTRTHVRRLSLLGVPLAAAAMAAPLHAAPLHAAPARLATTTPAVTQVRPGSGPVAGGTRATITGARLAHARAVTFGGLKASRLHVTSTRQIEVTTPRHAAGRVAVRVISTQGASTSAARGCCRKGRSAWSPRSW